MQDHKHRLDELRQEVDRIDDELIVLLSKRFDLAESIADLKLQASLPIYSPEREARILNRLPTDLHRQVFTVILEVSRALQAERQHRHSS
ncbi:MAG: chorismate mutase [Chloroherpetonaceae bacterium]